MSRKIVFYLLCGVFPFFVISCKNQSVSEEQVPVPVIIDGDWGSSTDDLFALDILEKAADDGIVDIKAVMADREGINYYAVMDLMNCWYGRPDTPMGIVSGAVKDPHVFIDYSKVMLDHRTSDGDSLRRSLTLEEFSHLPDATELYRKILSEAKDSSVVVFLLGFPTNLANLLRSEADEYSPLSGPELVAQKVKALYIMAGEFYSGNPEPDYNLKQDKDNARVLINGWTTPIYYSPMEVGQAVDYPGELVLEDLKDQPLNPIRVVYEKCFTATGQRMWDVCTVLQLTNPELFELSERGVAHIDDNMVVTFTPDSLGHDFHQKKLTDEGAAKVLKHLRNVTRQQPACK